MKKIPYINDVLAETIHGDPIWNDETLADGTTKRSQKMLTHIWFMLDRLTEPKFCGTKAGGEGVLYMVEVRAELKRQEATAKKRGYWLIENEPAAGLKDATLTPTQGYAPGVRFCIAPFIIAMRDMKEATEEDEAA